LFSRSTPFSSNILVAALALGAGAAIVVGCSAQTADSSLGAEPVPKDEESPNPGSPVVPAADAAAPKPPTFRGNPLCHVTADSCMPDDDGYRRTTGTLECATPPADAGDAATSEPSGSPGCRVRNEMNSGVTAPICKKETSSDSGDGATCKNGEDCAPGFDCVIGDKGNTCRHYCCAGTCKGYTSQNGGTTFCDVQNLTDAPLTVPVCMPLKRCTLLGTGECAQAESCAVVTESGDTGCVATGDAQVGASCDSDHCTAGLTCLGQPGSRECFKLCKVSSSECGPAQICTTSTVFKDPKYGICQKP